MEPCDITLLNKLQAIPQLDGDHVDGSNMHALCRNEHLLRCENEAMAEFIRRNNMWNAYQEFLKNTLDASTAYQGHYVLECIENAQDCARERSQGHSFLYEYNI